MISAFDGESSCSVRLFFRLVAVATADISRHTNTAWKLAVAFLLPSIALHARGDNSLALSDRHLLATIYGRNSGLDA